MKKVYNVVFFALALLIWTSPIAFAASLEVAPAVSYHNYKDAESAVGVGIAADVKGLFPAAPIVASFGFENVQTEKSGVDGSINSLSVGIGYDYAVEQIAGLTIRPFGSLDFSYISADQGFDASNDIGKSLGVRAEYAISDRISLFSGFGYQWLNTTVSNSAISQEVRLDNFNLKSGVSVKF